MTKYNVSIIIPYYKKYEEFRYSIEYNYEQFQKVNEVIVMIDERIDYLESFSFLNNYNVNFRFFMNQENHPWRNPAIVINKGIKEAISEKIIIISPETILLKDSLKNLIDNCDDKSFSIGQIIFMTNESYNKYNVNYAFNLKTAKNNDIIGPVYFGSICCTKKNFENVNYYTENFSLNGWGGEDDDVRGKLLNYGLIKKKIGSARFIHLERENEFTLRFKKVKKNQLKKTSSLYNFFNEIQIQGVDVNKVYSILDGINEIIKYSVSNNICCYYPVVLLAQCFNEEKNVVDYLTNVSRFVDAIIVLDDGSDDNTWNLLESNKLIIKIKVERNGFDDLKNRNLLLNVFENALVKNNIKVDWFLWLDFDERITDNKKFLHKIKRQILSREFDADVVYLPLFHMWDENNYNTEYPYSINGLQYKKRLIRNNETKMPYKINKTEKLHFDLSPYSGKIGELLLQIKHLSYVDEESRKRKYYLYTQVYDTKKTQKSYEHFLKEDVKVLPYNDFILYTKDLGLEQKINSSSNNIIQTSNKIINYRHQKIFENFSQKKNTRTPVSNYFTFNMNL